MDAIHTRWVGGGVRAGVRTRRRFVSIYLSIYQRERERAIRFPHR